MRNPSERKPAKASHKGDPKPLDTRVGDPELALLNLAVSFGYVQLAVCPRKLCDLRSMSSDIS